MESVAMGKRKNSPSIASALERGIREKLFRPELLLLPQVNEVYEFELAFYESQLLSDDELSRNGAYFAQVGDLNTRHFLICTGKPVKLPDHSSSRLKAFFKTNQFKTGYATHGLFPYRGKFHPQMIKGLLNSMGLRPGDSVLDPMMGSGTVLIEASQMGISSAGIDSSPFCRFMAAAKLSGLSISLKPLREALKHPSIIFKYFQKLAPADGAGNGNGRGYYSDSLFSSAENKAPSGQMPDFMKSEEIYDFLLLAYLDSAGYSLRSTRKPPLEQFTAILERYVFVVDKFQKAAVSFGVELAKSDCIQGDARSMPFENGSFDGIVFSPPYSFAIDYLENDLYHLNYLGTDVSALRESMVGLRGKNKRQKFENYQTDMAQVIRESSRVLRPGKICSIVVGTNNNQIGNLLGIAPEEVRGIDDLLIEFADDSGLKLVRRIERQIVGMANTMRTEYILMLAKQG
jgi:DNA modification methylase